MKLIKLVLIIVMLMLSSLSLSDDNRRDGNWWLSQDKYSRIDYLVGFLDGMDLGHNFSYWKYINGTKAQQDRLEQTTDSFYEYALKYFSNVTIGQLPAQPQANNSEGILAVSSIETVSASTGQITHPISTQLAAATLPNIFNRVLNWLIPAAEAAIPIPPGGPILIVTATCPTCGIFNQYYAEILRTEGLNEFATTDIASVTAASLAAYDVVILTSTPLTSTQVSLFTNWVNGGGNLIAIRPDPQLANLLGLTATGTTLSNAYLLVDTSRTPGNGIVNQPIQFHGASDRYSLSGATSLATLYSNASTATTSPALTLLSIGANGGQAAAFTYDLATSIVYTRQGNPAWATQERDGFYPIRPDDKFYGNANGDPQPDWVDLQTEVAVPQADEQQRLLANLITQMNLAKKPLPRFWYFPRGEKAVVIMTGDDHGNGGTGPRFDQFKTLSPAGCNVADWGCVRGTSYIYVEPTYLTDAQAKAYTDEGFEVSIHINTNCQNFTPFTLQSFYVQQLANFQANYPSIPAPITERHHCLVMSDWITGAQTELNHGIRMDTNYYFWPPSWVNNQPGLFTGSVMPMRFSDLNGDLLDIYQATSQMTDESGQTYPFTVDTLLDRALGSTGYYGAYVINAHTDLPTSKPGTDTVNSALARSVPVVSSVQMLNWLDGRNSSSFGSLAWNGSNLNFTVTPGAGANGLQAMLPVHSATKTLLSISSSGNPVSFIIDTIKGIQYAFFTAAAKTYTATYGADTTPPTVTSTAPANGATGVIQQPTITATFSESVDPTTVNASNFQLQTGSNPPVSATISYDASTRTAKLTPSTWLAGSTTYTATILTGIKDFTGNALAAPYTWSFTTQAQPCASTPCTAWSSSTTPGTPSFNDPRSVELGVKFKSDLDGALTGIRFYQVNAGTYVATLWSSAGQQLGTANVTATASGWQQANFSAPVAITANTVYVASYHASAGNYAFNNSPQFSTSGVDNAPLHLLQDGVSGANGLYAYSASSTFPISTFKSSNYWIDVAFTTNKVVNPCTSLANPIVQENCLAGTPASKWDVSGAGDTSIQGYATDISVNQGGTVNFKINTPASAYRLDIYRMGYYGGNGARKVATVTPTATLPQSQPACLTASATGLIDCGNWAVSASWTVPANAASGIYFARAMRTDTGGSSHIVFIVRNDASTSNILFQTSDTTWQAYNDYGGNSLYLRSPGTNPGRAYKVSYNRPFHTRVSEWQSWVFNAEYPMVRWLEANGYDVSYFSEVDTERNAALIKNHKVWMSNGHDEYWSAGQRASVEAARDAGVHLAFFSGNTMFWKTRWENAIDGSGTPYRTMVCYKETHANAVIDPSDPPTWTGTWRDPRFSPPADGGQPENALMGTIFSLNYGLYGTITVPQADGQMRFWRNTSVATLGAGQVATLAPGIIDSEVDDDEDNGFRPAGLFELSNTPINSTSYLLDYGSTYGAGTIVHKITLYKAPSGAWVFSTGTYGWSWGLDAHHDFTSLGSATDVRMQQATVNLFADMGVQPATLQGGIVTANASTDTTAPISAITSPAAGSNVTQGSSVTISGTATDAGGGVVGGVEVSVDGGVTWHPATGRGNWSYVWTPISSGAVTIKSRAVDDSGNLESPGAGINVTIGIGTSCTSNCTIWPGTAVPGLVDDGDPRSVELGVKFTADTSGTITGIRFYKANTNTGTHVGNLWTSTGTLLAAATFMGETASGWQQVNFSTPVAITANTVYVASYHANAGHYSDDVNYFASTGVDSPPLHALANGVSGANGVYAYGASSTFPNQTWNYSNYWVDVVFSLGPPQTIITTSLPAGTQGVAYSATLTASGGTPPYTWSITGSLPSGLTLNTSTGVISGTPNATGTFSFTTQVSDSASPVVGTATKTLSITVAANTDTGFLSSTANAAVTTNGDGNGFQTNPVNAYANDGLFAVDTNSGTGTSTSCTGSGKDRHIYYTYGFSLPGAASVKGIEVRLDAKADGTTGAPKMCVQLSWDGGTTWTAAKSTATLTQSEATYVLGGAADTWGRAWTVSNFSNANFRVRITDVASSTARTFSLDWVAVRATYQ